MEMSRRTSMEALSRARARPADTPQPSPDRLSRVKESLALLGIGSAGAVLLQGSGFFVHLGESYLLGVNIPQASSLDYLQLGGLFFYKTVESILQIPLVWALPAWLGGETLLAYPVVLAVLLGLAAWLRSGRTTERQRYGRLLRIAGWLIASGGVLFALAWLRFLSIPFAYTDMLFPMDHARIAESREKLAELLRPIEESTLNELAKRGRYSHYQRHLLRSELLRQETEGNSTRRNGFLGWSFWQSLPESTRTLSYGCFSLTSLLFLGGLLAVMGRLVSRESHAWEKESERWLLPWLRPAILSLLGAVVLFQLCSLPFTYGSMMQSHQFPLADVTVAAGPQPEVKEELLVLGEASGRLYLYSSRDLWTLHVVAGEAVHEIKIRGKKSALAWIDDLYLENFDAP